MFGKKKTTDVLVVGAGPVGLFTALQIARQGLEVSIIDEQWRTAARSYALALHGRTLRLLQEVELAAPLLAAGRRISRLGFFDRTGPQASVDLATAAGGAGYVLALPQNVLEAELEKRLTEAGVHVEWSHRLNRLGIGDGGVTATIEQLGKESTGYSVSSTEWVVEKTQRLDARFVVGADGHSSVVRQQTGIEFESLGGRQQFAVFECSSDGDAGEEMRIVLEADSTSVYWPLAGDRFRWSFELTGEESVPAREKHRLAVQVGERSYPYVASERLREFVEERAPWFEASIEAVHWAVGVRFENRLASEFGRGPVVLVGDAAHVASPIGVQSMNAGLWEGHKLAALLRDAVKEGASEEAVEEFGRTRASAWRRLLKTGAEPASDAEVSPWVRDRADRIPTCLPAAGDELSGLLAALGLKRAA